MVISLNHRDKLLQYRDLGKLWAHVVSLFPSVRSSATLSRFTMRTCHHELYNVSSAVFEDLTAPLFRPGQSTRDRGFKRLARVAFHALSFPSFGPLCSSQQPLRSPPYSFLRYGPGSTCLGVPLVLTGYATSIFGLFFEHDRGALIARAFFLVNAACRTRTP